MGYFLHMFSKKMINCPNQPIRYSNNFYRSRWNSQNKLPKHKVGNVALFSIFSKFCYECPKLGAQQ